MAGTRTALSAGHVGAFGGMVRIPDGMHRPTLVLSTDGVGTKVLVALEAGRFDTVGEDLVNHSVNDILVHGATPIAFMDYIAGSGLGVEQIAGLVEGIARGCRAHDMALAGGETAQMPGLYRPGTYDLAGTIVGVVEEDARDPWRRHPAGRRPAWLRVERPSHQRLHAGAPDRVRAHGARTSTIALAELDRSVGDVLLDVHRSYYRSVKPVLAAHSRAGAHHGGRHPGQPGADTSPGCEAVVDPGSWEVPPLFEHPAARRARYPPRRCATCSTSGSASSRCCRREAVPAAQAAATADGVDTWTMGEIRPGAQAVRFS